MAEVFGAKMIMVLLCCAKGDRNILVLRPCQYENTKEYCMRHLCYHYAVQINITEWPQFKKEKKKKKLRKRKKKVIISQFPGN